MLIYENCTITNYSFNFYIDLLIINLLKFGYSESWKNCTNTIHFNVIHEVTIQRDLSYIVVLKEFEMYQLFVAT